MWVCNLTHNCRPRFSPKRANNDNLEQQAQSLYDELFANESVSSLTNLGDVIETTSGGTPSRSKPSFYENGTINWVKSKELNRSFIIDTEEFITNEAVTKSATKILPKNSVLIAMYGATVGEYAIISKQMTCNQAVCALLPNNKYPYPYLFMFAKNKKKELINNAIGSAQQNISQILVKQLFISRNVELINKYDLIVRPLFEKILELQIENEKISQLRDVLLPKLMSAELKISDLNS
ncbi:restriction endonuclease S subunit [Parabacteroides sp. PFB2-10]|uniref:restriction endonuclease subunit S n=1 Tax=Parabacteroides sp. PFB2-10 TaxID=1742405 RepID=UPI0024767735|nr:restriction endonuclease subunit S [Parabacteroides sp. PFB2-10]MDH6312670.1 restriction endonuclease S subunit [Parabacteroides sp. PFB2-10]